MKPQPGIYYNVPFETYQSWDAINPSAALYARISMRMYKHAKDKGDPKSTKAMEFGTAAHCAIWEPDEFPRKYVLWEGGDRRGKAYDAFKAATHPKKDLKPAEYDACIAMRKSVMAHPAASLIVHPDAKVEVCIVWVDPVTGLLCKGRIDYLTRRINDWKFTHTLAPHMIRKHVSYFGYHVRLAAYQSGWNTLTNETKDAVLIFVKTNTDHDCVVHPLPADVIDRGHEIWTELLTRIAECEESGKWPGVADEEIPLELPSWEQGLAPELNFDGVEMEAA